MKRPALLSVLIFIVLVALTLLIVYQQSQITREDEDRELQNKLIDTRERFRSVLNENISAANTLATLYKQNGGIKKFDAIAQELVSNHKYIDIICLSDKFVVTDAYPLAGNEFVIGYNMLSDSFRHVELLTALEKKDLKFTGPFMLRHNRGMVIAGRVPIYMNNELKGISIVITRLSTIKRFLDGITNGDRKFIYQLSKRNPLTNRVENFFEDTKLGEDYVKTAYIPEGEWQLHVAFGPGYKHRNSLIIIFALGLLLSTSVAIFVYSKAVQKRNLVRTVEEKTHLLGERVKELSIIYHLNNLLRDEEQNVDDVFQKLVGILPGGWQYVDICRAKITFDGKEYITPGYLDNAIKQHEEFKLEDGRCGTIDMVYLKEMPQVAEGPFLKEERDLINSIARSLEIFLNKVTQENERKKMHRDLELSFSLTRATIESTADGILVVSRSGHISDYNTQFLKLWKVPKDVMDSNDAAVVLAYTMKQMADPQQFESKIKELYANPSQESVDVLYFLDGRVFERHAKPQIANNEIVGRVWNFRDVTQQKQSESEIRQLNAELENRVKQRTAEIDKLNEELQANVQNLEVANKDLESFSYSVSHDLRAPLRSINGFAGMLVQKATNLDEQSQKFIKVIMDNAQKMNQLIEDILAFSRTGRKEVTKEAVDMNALLQEVLTEVNIRERNERTELVAGDLLPAYADKHLMKQVLINLVSNAAKYASKKEKPVIEVGSYVKDNEQVYFFKDNGAGFDMKYYDKLFKVFQRMHSAEEFEGTGVGLAIVQKIVAKHGGRVWAEGEENVGATFYFTLPVTSTP